MAQGFKLVGFQRLLKDFKNFGKYVSGEMEDELDERATGVMQYAKVKRFRVVSSPNRRHRGKLVSPPVPGILTSRHGGHGYKGRITPPKRTGRLQRTIFARVPYAARHEKDRPVLSKALDVQWPKIIEAMEKRAQKAIKADGWP